MTSTSLPSSNFTRYVPSRAASIPAFALHAFDHPVGFRHLVLNEALAPARVQFGEARVGEIDVRCLHPVPEWILRRLIPVPGIARPGASTDRFVRADLAHIGIELG